MELKIISPTEDGFIKNIEFNFEELKTEMASRLVKYEGLVYNEESIQDAKKDRATLNKLHKALSDKRIVIKKLCLAPYVKFEAQIKELSALIQQPMLAIDNQVKGYETQKKETKQKQIVKFWEKSESSAKTLIKFESVFNDKWLNATVSMTKVETEITALFDRVENEMQVIKDLKTEFEGQVVSVYLQGFSIARALTENTRLLENKRLHEAYLEEQRIKKEQQAQAAEARRKALEDQKLLPAAAPVQKTAEPEKVEVRADIPKEAPKVEQIEDPVQQIDFRVWATKAQLSDLKGFLAANGIRYGRVTQEAA
ncbi:MAG: hypothetical protein BA863_08645 [Desulfovibrio sp. S3730MH75]|nr:MAG: hypothetical protein BA863_08645 [Desulfovibrio sp. S3730MH75]